MPATYEPIATTTLGSAASAITFNSIGAGYTDLRVVLVCQNASSTFSVKLNFNNDTASNYSFTYLRGNGTAASSGRGTNSTFIEMDAQNISPNWALNTADIFSYAGSTNKTALITGSQDANGSGGVYRYVGLWRNTAAITRVDLTSVSNNFTTGTTATLYGILKA